MDTFLGPYPYEHFKKWVSLTNHITKDLLERVQPVCKKISSVMELAQQPLPARSKTSASVDTISSLAQNQETLIRFSEIPKQRYPDGASPLEISKYSMDSSYALSHLIDNMKGELSLVRVSEKMQTLDCRLWTGAKMQTDGNMKAADPVFLKQAG